MGNLEPNTSISSLRIGRLISCLVNVCTTYLVLLMRGWDMTNDVTSKDSFPASCAATILKLRGRRNSPVGGYCFRVVAASADGCSYRSSLDEYD